MARTKKDVVREFRTAEILVAANRVFAERGYDEATIAEIAKAAGVAKGTVYLYYRSKREIYFAALRRLLADLHEQTRASLAVGTTVDEKIKTFISTKLDYFERHRDFFRFYFAEVGRSLHRHGSFQKQVDELLLEQVHALEVVLQQAVKQKLVRPTRTKAAAFAIFDITRGVVVQRARGWSQASLEDDAAFAFELTWKGLAQR
jgi:AcrR family transcriptional regulator